MQSLLKKLDDLAGLETDIISARWLERIAFVFLILMVVSAPHSIAATQTAWVIGILAWVIRLFVKPGPKFKRTPLDIALWAFFGWSAISSFVSYAPDISIDRLRGTALFLIFYFVIYNLRNLRAVYFLAFALIFSCMVNVVWTPIQRIIGRGVEIHGLGAESALAKALLIEGDTLLEANGKKLKTPGDLMSELEKSSTVKVKFYRPDFEFVVDVKRSDLLEGTDDLDKLGIESWKKSRNWRSSGFYGHYATYSEVLQLIASLVFGLLVAAFGRREEKALSASLLPFSPVPPLFFSLAAMCVALLLTVTRASQLAFMISAAAIVIAGLGRKWVWRAAVIGLPVAIIGLLFLQQSRQVGFFDSKDDSIIYRETMWRDGYRVWTENPRNFVAGVGMDSIQRYWREWGMFDGGRMPMGHFHSTPMQLLVERGLPALIIWLIVLGIYARTLWRGLIGATQQSYRVATAPGPESGEWRSRGILLGCLGGMIGFFSSSLVHYNLGDQEVAMVFFLLMGFGVKLTQFHETPPDERNAAAAEVEYRMAA